MSRTLALIFITLLLAGCGPYEDPRITISTPIKYDEAYRRLLDGMQACFHGAVLDHDLYTDIPQAEIGLSQYNPSTIFVTGSMVTSTTEHASNLLRLSIKGTGTGSNVEVSNKRFQRFVESSLRNAPECPGHTSKD